MTNSATLIGRVQSVTGSVVTVRLKYGQASLVMIEGESHRIGQVGSMVRIPLGYTHLYGLCSQVGAAAIPSSVVSELGEEIDSRWMTITLFGEVVGDMFDRGVSQYPTINDEVHVATTADLQVIYNRELAASLEIGSLAAAKSIPATLDLGRLVSRHSAVVGSTGAGKSNFVAVIMESISSQGYPSARILVIDPHGEYAQSIGENGVVFSATPVDASQRQLHVPFWALPFDEFIAATLGEVSPQTAVELRDIVRRQREKAAGSLAVPVDPSRVTADTPIPFSAKALWYELNEFEIRTYRDVALTNPALIASGDIESLTPSTYEPYEPGMKAPFKGTSRMLTRQLETMRYRFRDPRFSFLLAPGDDYTPDLIGTVGQDLDHLLESWVGHDKPVTVLDLSGAASETLSLVVGTVLRLVSDALYWAGHLGVGSRQQPLLVVLEEAHLFIGSRGGSAAHRAVDRISKEGRKHGVGLMLVSQRPTDLDSTALSQCGTMIALRLTNQADRSCVSAALPDELSNLSSLLPSLRTGEAIVTGEAVSVPSRFRVRQANHNPVGADPDLAASWRKATRPDATQYAAAIEAWRRSEIPPETTESEA